jgi:hypothetical protein
MTPEPIIRRGTNVPIAFTMPPDFSMAGAVFTLAVSWRGGRLDYAENSGLTVNAGARTVTWSPSIADVATIPLGRIADIEIQWVRGTVQDSDFGKLTIEPGISLD